MGNNYLYEKTAKRMARLGITDPTAIIESLTGEIDIYRLQIQNLKEANDKTLKQLNKLEKAMERMPRFGYLFVDYEGCPRGSMGTYCGSLEEAALMMPKMTDVEGDEWIPVKADVLHRLLDRIKEAQKRDEEEMMFYILERLPRGEILAQLAEEADELGHSALKMRRVIDGRNPTPVTLEEAQEMLEEEVADVMLCFLLLGIDWNDQQFGNRVAYKMNRWIERLREKEAESHG